MHPCSKKTNLISEPLLIVYPGSVDNKALPGRFHCQQRSYDLQLYFMT